ncbi:MAG: hypothetical protein LM577_04960 [Thermoproteaceae archaeon]|nr:hypothetical protein [Thermoproteaceae archaeon]
MAAPRLGAVAKYAAIVAAAAALTLAALALCARPVVSQGPAYSVAYYSGLQRALQLEVVNETGRPVVFCATLYGWLPNGSFAQIGWRCGEGAVSMDKSSLDEYLRHFAGVPGEVGVIAFITYVSGTDRSGRPALARSAAGFTVDPREALRRDAVRVTMRVKSRGAPRQERAGSMSMAPARLEWPEPSISEYCYVDYSTYDVICYYWRLDRIYGSEQNVGIPLVAIRVAQDYDKVNRLHAWAYLRLEANKYLYIRGSGAVRYLGTGPPEYSGDIWVYKLYDVGVYLNDSMHLLLGYDYPVQPVILAFGFYGDWAAARYKEVEVHWPSGYEEETGYVADIYLMKPVLSSGKMVAYKEADDGIYDDKGPSKFFKSAAARWSYKTTCGDYYARANTTYVVSSVSGTNLFAIGIPLPEPVAGLLDVTLTAGVGADKLELIVLLGMVKLADNVAGVYDVFARYYVTPEEFTVGPYSTRIGSLYIDAYAAPQGSCR